MLICVRTRVVDSVFTFDFLPNTHGVIVQHFNLAAVSIFRLRLNSVVDNLYSSNVLLDFISFFLA